MPTLIRWKWQQKYQMDWDELKEPSKFCWEMERFNGKAKEQDRNFGFGFRFGKGLRACGNTFQFPKEDLVGYFEHSASYCIARCVAKEVMKRPREEVERKGFKQSVQVVSWKRLRQWKGRSGDDGI